MNDDLIAEVKAHIADFTARRHAAGIRSWTAVLDRIDDGEGGMSDAEIAGWLAQARRHGWQDGIETLPKVQEALRQMHRAELGEIDPADTSIEAEVGAHIARFKAAGNAAAMRDWAAVLERLNGAMPPEMDDARIRSWWIQARQHRWQDGVETLPKVCRALQARRTGERAWEPVVYNGASMPDDFWQSGAEAKLNADSIVLILPPDGWWYHVIGEQPEVAPDGGRRYGDRACKLLSPAAFDRVIPRETARLLEVQYGTTYRARLRWRRSRLLDWLEVTSTACALSDRFHAWGRAFSGNFGGCALPDPVDWSGA